MPIYEFKCDKCETIKSIKCSYKQLLEKIPICCEKPMERYYGGGTKYSVIYKGDGFSTTNRWGDMSRERTY